MSVDFNLINAIFGCGDLSVSVLIFLSITSISNLDIAMCCERKDYLIAISSKFCIFDTIQLIKYENSLSLFVVWVTKRNIHINHLNITQFSKEIIENLIILLKNCSSLNQFDFSKCRHFKFPEINEIIDNCPGLKLLNISSVGIISNITHRIDINELIIKIANKCSALEILILGYGLLCSHVEPASIIEIADKCSRLKSLNLGGCIHITNDVIIKIANQCPCLELLNLDCCDITNDAIFKIADKCPRLNSLSLRYSQDITNDAIIAIADKCPRLNSLSLVHLTKITNEAILAIANNCPDLFFLNVSNCKHIKPAIKTYLFFDEYISKKMFIIALLRQ